MEYLLIEGHRKGSKLLYTPTDGHLYVKKTSAVIKRFIYATKQFCVKERKKRKNTM